MVLEISDPVLVAVDSIASLLLPALLDRVPFTVRMPARAKVKTEPVSMVILFIDAAVLMDG